MKAAAGRRGFLRKAMVGAMGASLAPGQASAEAEKASKAGAHVSAAKGGNAQAKVKPVKLAMLGPTAPGLYHTSLFVQLINGADRAAWEAAGFSYTWGEPFSDARVVAVWAPERAQSEVLARLCNVPTILDRPEDAIGLVDGVIVCNSGEPLIHAQWAKPFVAKRIPTLVDKPLAGTLAEVEEIIALAKANDSPLMSASGFRYSAVLAEHRRKMPSLGKIWSATVMGPVGQLAFYGVHALEPAHSVMGPGAEWVQNIGELDRHVVRVAYPDGRSIVLQCFKPVPWSIHLTLFGEGGYLDLELGTDEEVKQQYFHRKLLHHFVEMVKTGKPPIPLDTTLEIMRILYLGEKSLAEGGKRIPLRG